MAQQNSLAQGCGAFAGLAVLIFAAVYMCSPDHPSSDNQQAVSEDDKPSGPLGIIKSSGQITNAQYVDAIGKVITARGYECPEVRDLWIKGTSPYGTKLEALCGDIGEKEPDVNLHYTVYPERFMVVVCQPLGVLGGGCD